MFTQESGILVGGYTGAMEYAPEILKYELDPNGQLLTNTDLCRTPEKQANGILKIRGTKGPFISWQNCATDLSALV